MLFPDEIKPCLESRGERPENETALLGCVDKIIECQEIAKVFFGEKRSIIRQLE